MNLMVGLRWLRLSIKFRKATSKIFLVSAGPTNCNSPISSKLRWVDVVIFTMNMWACTKTLQLCARGSRNGLRSVELDHVFLGTQAVSSLLPNMH